LKSTIASTALIESFENSETLPTAWSAPYSGGALLSTWPPYCHLTWTELGTADHATKTTWTWLSNLLVVIR